MTLKFVPSWKGWQIHGKHENVGMAQTQGRGSIIIFQPQVHPALRADTIILIIDLDFPERAAPWSPCKVVTQVSKERFHFKSLGSRRVRCCRAKGHLCLMRTRGHTELRMKHWVHWVGGDIYCSHVLVLNHRCSRVSLKVSLHPIPGMKGQC